MTDPLRSGRPPLNPEASERDRDARVEQLLLTGLDHYFSGRHDLAVNVWTRVLFLDRGHARARAYIERARGAIAERQREGEELVHAGLAAFQRGDQAEARGLLMSAVERGAGGEEAMAVLQRLERLEAAAVRVEPGIRHPSRAGREVVVPPAESGSRVRLLWTIASVVAGVVLGALTLVAIGDKGSEWLGFSQAAPAAPPARVEEPLHVPAASELVLERARALRTRGHLREALTVLENVRHGDRFRSEADQLRGAIQQDLLAAARGIEQSTGLATVPR